MTKNTAAEFFQNLAIAQANAAADNAQWQYTAAHRNIELPAAFKSYRSVADVTVTSRAPDGSMQETVIPAGEPIKITMRRVTLPAAVYWPGGELPKGIFAKEEKRRQVAPGQFGNVLGGFYREFGDLIAAIGKASAKLDAAKGVDARVKAQENLDAARAALYSAQAATPCSAAPAAPAPVAVKPAAEPKPAAIIIPFIPAAPVYPDQVRERLTERAKEEIEQMDKAANESGFMDERNNPIGRRVIPKEARLLAGPGDAAVYLYESEYKNKKGVTGRTYLAKVFANGHGLHAWHKSFKTEAERTQLVEEFLAGERAKLGEVA